MFCKNCGSEIGKDDKFCANCGYDSVESSNDLDGVTKISKMNLISSNELIAQNGMDYVKKAVQLGKRKELIAGYHAGLREHLLKSALMDSQQYMKEIESCYQDAWKNYFCKTPVRKKRFFNGDRHGL